VERWMLVGDSWIDGKAAQEGNIKFVVYKGNSVEIEKRQVRPSASITDMRELLELVMWKQ
jgi:phosphoglycolate phosphatase